MSFLATSCTRRQDSLVVARFNNNQTVTLKDIKPVVERIRNSSRQTKSEAQLRVDAVQYVVTKRLFIAHPGIMKKFNISGDISDASYEKLLQETYNTISIPSDQIAKERKKNSSLNNKSDTEIKEYLKNRVFQEFMKSLVGNSKISIEQGNLIAIN